MFLVQDRAIHRHIEDCCYNDLMQLLQTFFLRGLSWHKHEDVYSVYLTSTAHVWDFNAIFLCYSA